jgi:hypothetical protein
LYGCETWFLTLREEHRLTVFENRVLKGIFGAKREEVAGGWRRLHNEELHAIHIGTEIRVRYTKIRHLMGTHVRTDIRMNMFFRKPNFPWKLKEIKN